MTGTYSGQFAMEGFLNINWARWKRVLLTRTIAILPTLFIARYKEENLTGMNDLLNALMSLQLPFALLPTLTFTSSSKVMGQFKNDFVNIITAAVLSIVVISINIFFVGTFVKNNFALTWWVILIAVSFVIYYLVFLVYLVSYLPLPIFLSLTLFSHNFSQVGCFLVVLGCDLLTNLPVIGKYMVEKHSIEYSHSLAQSNPPSPIPNSNQESVNTWTQYSYRNHKKSPSTYFKKKLVNHDLTQDFLQ